MDLDAVVAKPLLEILNYVVGSVITELGMDPAQPNLFQEKQLIITGANIHHGGDLGIIWVEFFLPWAGGKADRRRARG
jgi:hypothetical protein